MLCQLLYTHTHDLSTTSSGAYYKYHMERTIYLIDSRDPNITDKIWHYTQYSGLVESIPMYKTRITAGTTGWVVELSDNAQHSLFLLNYSRYCTQITGTYYTI
jgi:hypothetical protein